MSERVWVSNAYTDSTLIKMFEPPDYNDHKLRYAELAKRHDRGEPLGEEFPKVFVGKYRDEKMKRQPDFFSAGGIWCVSEQFSEVVRHFDLGEGSLHPVTLLQFDRTTPVEGTYYGLDLGARKNCLAISESRLKKMQFSDTYNVPNDHHDDDIAVTRGALEGADIWIDPKLSLALFFSDRLTMALKGKKLATRLRLKRCRVLTI